MMRRVSIITPATIVVLLVAAGVVLTAAPLRNQPVTLSQPDGSTLNVFVSGDEYFNWIHDKDGYTIIHDPESGYYTYAILSGGLPVPTSYIVGRSNPSAMGLERNALPKKERMQELRAELPHGSGNSSEEIINAPPTGTIQNLVVFIRFSGDSEFGRQVGPYDAMFNSSSVGANSMYNYYREVSYTQLDINTSFYPTASGGSVASYQDSHPREYFQPYSASNPIGYTGGSNGSDRTNREHTLLAHAINAVAAMIPADLAIDADGDGKVDNVCFIIRGGPTGWNSLLWPHMWSLYTQNAYIRGKQVYTYNFQLETALDTNGVGVLCHEMFHSIGAPDLYHYQDDNIQPVYKWDLMEYDLNPPQHMTAYMKYRYGKWISTIPTISTSGTYTLNPLTSSTNNVYRINSPNSSTEYFLVEFRKKTSIFEQSLPGEGMLIYRINSAVTTGNMNGPPDEVYIYRPDGTLTFDGNPTSANYSADVGRTSMNDGTNPSSFLSSGGAGGLKISNISAVGSTISFQLGSGGSTCYLSKPTLISPTGTVTATPTYSWNAVSGAEQYQLYVSDSGTQGKIQSWYQASAIGCSSGIGTCSVTPSTSLAAGSATFWIRAWASCNGGTYSNWSDGRSFTVSGGGAPSGKILQLYPVSNATVGSTAVLWAQVQNTGSTAFSANAKVWFYVSGLPNNWVGSTSVANLGVGGTQWYAYNWAIPSAVSARTYQYWAIIYDGNSPISPWSLAQAFTISTGGGGSPSAKILSLWDVNGATAGGTARLWAQVQSNGSSALPANTLVWFWVSGLANNWVGYASVGGLQAGSIVWAYYDWTIPSNLTTGSYSYYARVYSGNTALSDWSAAQSFVVSSGATTGFNEQFDGTTAPNWNQDSGTWIVSGGYYHADGSGLADMFGTSTYNKAEFSTLDYTAWLYRTEASSNQYWNSAGLVIRAFGGFTAGDPDNSYEFLYHRGGKFSVWKNLNGFSYELLGWTASPYLNTGDDWNKLRVIATGSSLEFYINDELVWQGSDASLTTGRVGFLFYSESGSTSDQLWVDSAVLSTNVGNIQQNLSQGEKVARDLVNGTGNFSQEKRGEPIARQ